MSDRISAFTAARGYPLYYTQSPLTGALNLAGSGALRARAAGQAEGGLLSAPVAPFLKGDWIGVVPLLVGIALLFVGLTRPRRTRKTKQSKKAG